jgi:hypothetical protein
MTPLRAAARAAADHGPDVFLQAAGERRGDAEGITRCSRCQSQRRAAAPRPKRPWTRCNASPRVVMARVHGHPSRHSAQPDDVGVSTRGRRRRPVPRLRALPGGHIGCAIGRPCRRSRVRGRPRRSRTPPHPPPARSPAPRIRQLPRLSARLSTDVRAAGSDAPARATPIVSVTAIAARRGLRRRSGFHDELGDGGRQCCGRDCHHSPLDRITLKQSPR